MNAAATARYLIPAGTGRTYRLTVQDRGLPTAAAARRPRLWHATLEVTDPDLQPEDTEPEWHETVRRTPFDSDDLRIDPGADLDTAAARIAAILATDTGAHLPDEQRDWALSRGHELYPGDGDGFRLDSLAGYRV